MGILGRSLSFVLVLTAAMAAMPLPAAAQGASPGPIEWKNAAAQKAAGSPAAVLANPAPRHVVLQFAAPLAPGVRQQLEARGVTLLAYLGSNAYFAALSGADKAADAATAAGLVSAEEIDPAHKLHPRVAAGDWPEHAIASLPAYVLDGSGEKGGEEVLTAAVCVVFHGDVDQATAGAEAVARHGGLLKDAIASVNAAVVWVPAANVAALAAEDCVQWIEPVLPKMGPVNNSNRVITQADAAQTAPYNLDGTGVNVLVYDGGTARGTHLDFGGRLTVRDASGMADHATHVAGTVGGSGAASGGTYRGMAPGVTIQSYGFEDDGSGTFLYTNPGDIEADYTAAVNTYGAVIANNSIGTNTAANGFPCEYEGDYGVTDQVIDALVRGSLGSPMRIVWANGNERGNGRCGTEYLTTAPPACAKNHITVGAVNSNDEAMTSFSSWGPTDDGRIKPDVSGPGCQSDDDGAVTSCSSTGDTAYTTMCGTSMAAPTVTGLCALILQDFKVLHPADPLPRNSTLKVLLAHNAVDLGNVGPDYLFGYGSVRVTDTIDFMRGGSFREDSLDQGEAMFYIVPVTAGDPFLKVTVAWDDAPGAVNTIPELVNDLDLTLTAPDGTTVHYPWTLDPANPSAPAVQTQADHRNNIEQVFVNAPAEGNWIISVAGTSVPSGPQVFSLAASPALYACTSAGILTLDRAAYRCEDTLGVTVNDCDLDADPGTVETVTVTVASTTEPAGETVVLTETGMHTATFTGSLPLSAANAPGTLQTAGGDTLTASYVDADDGMGGTNVTVTVTAVTDCTPPVIGGEQALEVKSTTATLTFTTDTPTTGRVLCGTVCGDTAIDMTDWTPGTTHTFALSGLTPLTPYYFSFEAEDAAGNQTVSPGSGCFNFTTTESPDYFTEWFDSADFDLEGQTLFFTPDGSLSYYHACREAASAFPTDPTGGTALAVGDDNFAQVDIGAGQHVSLYGVDYTTFYVGSNGYLTFGAGSSASSRSLENQFALPRVSGLFRDLNPGSAGTVSWRQLADRVAVTFENVPVYGTTNSNNFQFELFFDGRVTVTHLAMDATDAICGLSEGNGVPVDYVESDLSAYSSCDPMLVTPGEGFSSSGHVSGPFTPADKVYTVANNGAADLHWTAGTAEPWFTVSPATGTLPAGAESDVTVSLNATAETLPVGSHTGTVLFTNTDSGHAVARGVALEITAIPGEIVVTDSILPDNDLAMPFGDVIHGLARTEQITVSNTDGAHDLVISDINVGGLLYMEDFEDGLAQDWVEYEDAWWSVSGGKYSASSSSSLFMSSRYTGDTWTDLDASVAFSWTGINSNTQSVFVRATSDFIPEVSGSGLGVGVADGEFWVIRYTDGSITWIQGWTSSALLNPVDNLVTLSVNGSDISVYFNGSLAWTGTDPSPGAGHVALGGWSWGGNDPVQIFDDVRVGLPGEIAGTGGKISTEQAWYNAHPVSGYGTGQAPPASAFPAYDGPKSADSAPTGGVATAVSPFTLGGLPALPHAVPPGGALTFDVTFAPQRLGAADSTVSIVTNDDDEPEVAVAVTGNGIADDLAVDPSDGFSPYGPQGGPFGPSSADYTLTNNGAGDLNWTAAVTQPWLSVSPASGTLAGGGSVTVTVSLTPDAAALATGTYTDTVSFVNTGNGVTSTRPVELTAVEPMSVSTGTDLDAFGYVGGPFTPECQTYDICNNEGGILNWSAVFSAPWVTVTPSSGALDPYSCVTVNVCIGGTADTLTPGNYTDTVTFSNDSSGYSAARSVALEVEAVPGEIEVTDTIAPADDLAMPYGYQLVGSPRTENITVSNTSGAHDLVISDILFGAFYREDFSDGLAQGWVEYEDAMWDVVDGHYRAQTASAYYMSAVYTAASWSDLDVVATLGRAGVNTNTHALFVRASSDFVPEVSGSALGVGISAEGSFWVIRFDGATFTWIQDWTPSALLDPVTNTVRLSVEGSAINVFLNETLAWTGTDPSPSAGHIALAGYSPGGNDPVHSFDDVTAGPPGFALSTGAGISAEQAWRNAHPVTGGSASLAPPASAFPVYKGPRAETGAPAGMETSGSSFSLSNMPTLPYTVAPGSSVAFDVVYNPAAAGPDASSVLIQTNDADEPEVSVAVTGTGLDDYLVLDPEYGLDSSGYEGGLFSPVGTTYTLTNHSGADISWTAAPTQPWVTVSPAGGTLGAFSSTAVEVTINTAASTLTPGTYTDTVTFANTGSAYTTTRDVALEVIPLPGEVQVTDSVLPADDLQMPLGNVMVGVTETGQITVTNVDPIHDLSLEGVSLVGFTYTEDFESGSAPGWVPTEPGSTEVVAGEYVLSSGSGNDPQSYYSGMTMQNGSIEADARLIAPNSDLYWGLFLRASADFAFNPGADAGTGYVLVMSPDGDYCVLKVVSGSFTDLSCTSSGALNTGEAPNTVRFSADGSLLEVIFNGVPVWSTTDSDISGAGYAGVCIVDGFGGAGSCAFGEVRITPVGAEASAFSLSGVPSFPLTLNPGGFTTFDVNFTPTGEGPFTDSVLIATNDLDEPVTEVLLSGNGVLDDLWVSPVEPLVSSGGTGGPFDPTGKEYLLNNAGGSDVNWTVGLSEAWLDVSVSSGILAAGTSTSVVVSLNSNANALPFGVHTAVVSFTNTATSVSITRDVELTAIPDPPIARIEAPASLEATLSQEAVFTFDPALNLCNDGEDWLEYTISVQYNEPVLDKQGGGDRVRAAVDTAIERSGILDGPLSIKGAGNAAAAGTKAADTLSDPAQVASVMTAAEAGITTASTVNVAVYGADDTAYLSDVQAKLISTGQFGSVATFNLGAVTPTLAELQAFDAVLVYGNMPYADATALGDAMADYAAGGGGVVCSVFEVGDNLNSCMMQGRWVSGGYVLMDRPTTIDSPATLGTVHDPGHPIMTGVVSFNGGSSSYRPTTTSVYPGTTLVAEWSDGHPLVAVADVNGALRADVCFYPPSSDVSSDFWDASTDGARMLANALVWTAGGQNWLQVQDPSAGAVAGGACAAKTVTFDAAGLAPGVYTADILIEHNDPGNPSVTVPCTLTVRVDDLRAQPETGLDAEGYFGGPFAPGQAVYTLTNAGAAAVPWQAAADAAWADVVPASGTLDPGGTVDVTVSVNAAAQSLVPADYTGRVTFSNTGTGYKTYRSLDLTVLEPLSVTPDTVFRSRGAPGGPFAPLTASYTLTNAGPSPVPWHLTPSETWLDAAPTSGTLDPGTSVEVLVALNIGVTALPAGTYPAMVGFVNEATTHSVPRNILLEIGREYHTELFDADDWDIQHQTLLFTPDSSPLFYGVCSAPAVSFPTDPTGGTPLTLTDDSSVQVDLPAGVEVYLYGTAYSTFYVGSNGYVTFTAGDSSATGSLGNHFSLPRVAGLYRDLDPEFQGVVSWKQLVDRVAVTFSNVPNYDTTNSNNFQIELYFDGRIALTHLGMDAVNGLAGLSAGAGVPADYLETDLTGFAGCPVTVPDVVGLQQGAAETALVEAFLAVGAVTESWSATVPVGEVISQNPAAAAVVPAGSAVDLEVSKGPEPVPVPDVVGLQQAAAESALTGAGLAVGTVTESFSATAPVGEVMSQTPAAGALALPGSAVDLEVSKGPEPVLVPAVVGLQQAAAESALTGAGLAVGTVTESFSATAPVGEVMSQNPSAGASVLPGTPVDIEVSKGPEPVTVPNVVGLQQAAAESALTGAGLAVGTVTESFSATAPVGEVMSQTPAAGTPVAPGTAVNMEVSKGPAPVTVPDVVGLQQAAAESALTGAGLAVGTLTESFSATAPVGEVMSQTPAAGASVAPGTAVDLEVSKGPAPVTVPDVVGLQQAAAESALTGAGLAVGTVTESFSETAPVGEVMSQTPTAGASVAPGTAVDLEVSKGPAPGGDKEVPNVVGMTQAQAESALTGAQLTLGTVTEVYSDTVLAGEVISQNPAAGAMVAENTPVNLTISKGPAPVAVPNVVGLTQAAAEAALTGAGLAVGAVTDAFSLTVPAGQVISQNPAAGVEVAPGTSVDLVVSKGPAPVTVPDVVGLTQAVAETALTGAGLTVGTVTESFSDTAPLGQVMSQTPAAGAEVAAGAAVNLEVSKGPAPAGDKEVPNVVGMTQAQAGSALVAAELTLGTVTEVYSATVPVGQVISQNPAAGAMVAENTPVNITVSKGPAPVAVPNVVGMTQAAAETALTGAGLAVGAVTEAYSATVPAGEVMSQTPAADTSVAPGTAVDLEVSKGPAPVTVPNVVGLQQAAAETALTGAGLAVGTVTESFSDTVPVGEVMSQTPAAGAEVAAGTAVNLEVSKGPAPAGDKEVPNVVGMTQAAAETALLAAQLTLGTVTEAFSATVPAGQVISQNPAAGAMVAENTPVNLTVSKGPAPVTVPDVVGLQQAAAATALTGAGLAVGAVTESFSATVPAGEVMSQTPAAGASVAPGTAVDLEVSKGPAPAVTVPDVVGMTQAAAATALTGAGLAVGTVTESFSATVPEGQVISQTPVAGASASAGSAVNLVVSKGPAPVIVPNVVGMTQAAAGTAIGGAGLTLGTVTESFSATVPAGQVVSQTPSAGASAAAGSAVSLVVSKGPQPVVVPDVVGTAEAQARSVIATSGLTVGGVAGAYSDTVVAGAVISQSPAAGAQAAPGSAVSLVVSTGPDPASVEAARAALAEVFRSADTNGDRLLSYDEAAGVYPPLTQPIFDALDLNDDGRLDKEELGVKGCGCGCTCSKADMTVEGLKSRLGDVFLGALALTLLAALGRRRTE